MAVYKQITLEKRIMQLSTLLAVVTGSFALFIAWYTSSIAILIDGAYTMISVLVDLLALYAVTKISKPTNKYYQYGYFKLEPLVVYLEALLVLSIAMVAITVAIIKLFSESTHVNLNIALLYAIIIASVCFTMHYVTKWGAKKSGSQILKANSQLWWADGAMTSVILIGFLLAKLLENSQLEYITGYIDPVLAIAIAFLIMRAPIKLIKSSFEDLLDKSPSKKIITNIQNIGSQLLNTQDGIKINDVRISRAGRKLFIEICYGLPEMIERIVFEKYNQQLRHAIKKKYPHAIVDFCIDIDSRKGLMGNI